MPLYDYKCREHGLFHELATMEMAGDPCPCPKCGVLSTRVVIIPPQILAMAKERKKRFEINEKAQHEPGVANAKILSEMNADKAHNVYSGNSCHCNTIHPLQLNPNKGKLQQQLIYLPDGSKIFPSQRPWMISH